MARKKYNTVYRDRLTGRLVSKRKWKANPRTRFALGKRFVEQKIHRREAAPIGGNFRYVIRKRTPAGQFRGTKWKESKIEVSITSDHKLDKSQIESLSDKLASGEELPNGIEVTLVEWTTGHKTKVYNSESDAEVGFSRFSEFFSEEIK